MSIWRLKAWAALAMCAAMPTFSGCALTAENDPASNASEANTPSVGPSESVEVDRLRWRLDHASTRSAIGEPSSGLRAKATGVYLVATLHVTNNQSEAVTLSENLIKLVAGKETYAVDSNAVTALLGEGHPAFLTETLGSHASATGTIAFDIPPSVLRTIPSLRFEELSFGPVHGYIRLPPLAN
jgi:hypothetical protein